MAAAAIASGALDLFEDRGRGGQFQPGAAIFLGYQYREVSRLRQRVDEGTGIGHLAIELAPIFAGELRTELGDGFADVGMFVLFSVGHWNSAGISRVRKSLRNGGQGADAPLSALRSQHVGWPKRKRATVMLECAPAATRCPARSCNTPASTRRPPRSCRTASASPATRSSAAVRRAACRRSGGCRTRKTDGCGGGRDR